MISSIIAAAFDQKPLAPAQINPFGGQVPAPVLYAIVGEKSEWKPVPDAMPATALADGVRYVLNYPTTPELKGVKGALGFALNPPVDLERSPYLEIRFAKPCKEVMLQIVYSYVDGAGKDGFNWFIVSPAGTAEPVPRTFVWKFGLGGEDGKPPPKQVKSLTLYANIYGSGTPKDCEFALYHLRVCRDTVLGPNPRLSAATPLH